MLRLDSIEKHLPGVIAEVEAQIAKVDAEISAIEAEGIFNPQAVADLLDRETRDGDPNIRHFRDSNRISFPCAVRRI